MDDPHKKFPGRADRMLKHARDLLAEKKVTEGLTLILQVAKEKPEALDPTLLATIPLWRSVVKHLAILQARDEASWATDGSGSRTIQ